MHYKQRKIACNKSGKNKKDPGRSVRALIRGLKRLRARKANVSVKKVVKESGLSFQMASRRTFNRYLKKKGTVIFRQGKKAY